MEDTDAIAEFESATETKRLVAKIFIAGSIDDVWNEITKTDELQAAMFNMRLHTDGLKLGGQIRMRTADGKYTGVVGEVLAWDPPHRYGHTFRFTEVEPRQMFKLGQARQSGVGDARPRQTQHAQLLQRRQVLQPLIGDLHRHAAPVQVQLLQIDALADDAQHLVIHATGDARDEHDPITVIHLVDNAPLIQLTAQRSRRRAVVAYREAGAECDEPADCQSQGERLHRCGTLMFKS